MIKLQKILKEFTDYNFEMKYVKDKNANKVIDVLQGLGFGVGRACKFLGTLYISPLYLIVDFPSLLAFCNLLANNASFLYKAVAAPAVKIVAPTPVAKPFACPTLYLL